ncbi:MAG: putative major facilitator superfamily transporter [Bacteroidetes bacterium]|nr:MAG: putative major facilitator superfamily transporter [Bacteroidota bacterium]
MGQLTISRQLIYASGMMGWSILVNIIGVLLPYFYLPPGGSGLHTLIPQTLFFGIFNLLAIITASGRLADAVYDPFIGQASDRSKHRLGRRIPFMRWSILPAIICCMLIFQPPDPGESSGNAYFLATVLILFFVSATTYIIPANALLPELAQTDKEKINLATWQQVGFAGGIIVAATSNNIADLWQYCCGFEERITALQWAIRSLCILAGILMCISAFGIDEKKWCKAKPSHTPLLPAIRASFRISNFRAYVLADFAYFMALYIVVSGLLYYVTVLAGLPEAKGALFMGTMVLTSLLFYPLIGPMVKRFGKKKLVVFSFVLLGLICGSVWFIGKLPVNNEVQMYVFVIMASFPLATLGILPPAILADIAQDEAKRTGENREGLFFAVKYFVVKLGQTLGIALFAMLTIYGKDPGDDLGLRITGICGMALCLLAALMFLNFRENKEK